MSPNWRNKHGDRQHCCSYTERACVCVCVKLGQHISWQAPHAEGGTRKVGSVDMWAVFIAISAVGRSNNGPATTIAGDSRPVQMSRTHLRVYRLVAAAARGGGGVAAAALCKRNSAKGDSGSKSRRCQDADSSGPTAACRQLMLPTQLQPGAAYTIAMTGCNQVRDCSSVCFGSNRSLNQPLPLNNV